MEYQNPASQGNDTTGGTDAAVFMQSEQRKPKEGGERRRICIHSTKIYFMELKSVRNGNICRPFLKHRMKVGISLTNEHAKNRNVLKNDYDGLCGVVQSWTFTAEPDWQSNKHAGI